jgi:tripartite-type tricarboxylate transporter receptor subunit TctC
MQDLVAGGVDIVTCSLPEARALIDAGKAKPLAVMDSKPTALFPKVPTMKEASGSGWTVSAWRGIAGPKGLPKDVETRLVTAIKKIWDSKEFKDFAESKGYGTAWAAQADFAAFMAKGDADMGVVMKAAGLAK